MNDVMEMVKMSWTKRFIFEWVLLFVGGIIMSIGDWCFLLGEHTWNDYLQSCTINVPGALLMTVGSTVIAMEYFKRKEDEGV